MWRALFEIGLIDHHDARGGSLVGGFGARVADLVAKPFEHFKGIVFGIIATQLFQDRIFYGEIALLAVNLGGKFDLAVGIVVDDAGLVDLEAAGSCSPASRDATRGRNPSTLKKRPGCRRVG
jgi:hypothetical protein